MVLFHTMSIKVVCDTIRKIEENNTSVCEVLEKLEILFGKIKNRKTQNF